MLIFSFYAMSKFSPRTFAKKICTQRRSTVFFLKYVALRRVVNSIASRLLSFAQLFSL